MSSTVQPSGIPLSPLDQSFINEFFLNVPFEDTDESQFVVQSFALILVALHLIKINDEQAENIK